MTPSPVDVPLPPAPRSVPFPVWVTVLFGGTRNQISWLMAGVVTSFFFVFVLDFTSLRYFHGGVRQVPGIVTEVDSTVFSTATVTVGTAMMHDRGREIERYAYRYAVGGRTYTGESYGISGEATAGSFVVVEYAVAHPAVSHIQHMSAEIHLRGGWVPVAVVGIVLLIVWLALVGRIREAGLVLHLLRNGRAVQATVVSKMLLSRSSGHEWWEYVLVFELDGRAHEVKLRPHHDYRLTEGESRFALFDRKRPGVTRLLDTLPRSVGWDKAGLYSCIGAGGLLALLWIPVAAAASIAVSVCFELFG